MTDTLTITGEYAYANDFEIKLRALTDLAKDYCLGGTGLIWGGNTLLGWLSGFWAQNGPVADCDFFRRLGEAAAPGGGECVPCPDFSSYTLAFALQLRKITENLSQVSRKALGWSEHDSFSRLGHRERWPRLAWWPLPPLAFASGDGVNPRSA